MRVIGGVLRGRRLASFRGLAIRPTSDMVREAVFNVLPPDFPRDKMVLDLFAGTGAMGIEALSRGAESALFIDRARGAVSIIWKNIRALGLEDRAVVVRSDVLSALERLGREGKRFGLVFIDPPYEAGLVEKVLRALAEKGIVERGGIVVAECSKRSEPVKGPEGLLKWNEKTYGDTKVLFYRVTEQG